MYKCVTRDISVEVQPTYLPDQSSPDENYFVWAYTVQIENHGNEVVQLRTRYWKITDATGQSQEVRGEGVIGEQPMLEPGTSFQYTSGTPLSTSSGIMVGSYQMVSKSGEMFNVDIPAFSLDSPFSNAAVH